MENDEEAARERAMAEVQAVVETSISPKELELAIKAALESGVTPSQLEEAEQRVKVLKALVRAREALFEAMDQRKVSTLEEAIAVAMDSGVPQVDIEAANAVLRDELPKQRARQQLLEAELRGDSVSLKAALDEARRVGVDETELTSFVELLRGAESKDKAEAALRKAADEKQVGALKFALRQAREVGADPALIAHGEEVLVIQEPREEARQVIAAAMDKPSIEQLKVVIQTAKEVGLEQSEYADAEALLEHEENKVRLMVQVNDVLAQVRDVATDSIDDLSQAKESLYLAIGAAKEGGVAEADLLDAELRRRRIHNQLQDLKGSIRVFCRVRPLISRELQMGDDSVMKQLDPMTIALKLGNHEDSWANFSFDAVFAPGTQEEVFEDCRDLVQSAIDGYNVTMFAYGQTGAGKTFTMYGAPGQEGTAPRTIAEIYKIIDRDKDRFNFTVMASMLELYRNDLVDLLNKPDTVDHLAASKNKLNVRMEKSGMVTIEHLVEEECQDAGELMKLLERGNEMRTVASTRMNSESSRSHSLLIIKVVSVNKETHDQLRGKILMCDLAGSERLKKSEASGDLQKEAIEINRSLTALGDVIEALTRKHKQIPYRNHKLTQLMQDSLGGTAKTLMFVNCSPSASNSDETMQSLRYATRAKMITNSAKRQSLALRGVQGSQLDALLLSPRPRAQ